MSSSRIAPRAPRPRRSSRRVSRPCSTRSARRSGRAGPARRTTASARGRSWTRSSTSPRSRKRSCRHAARTAAAFIASRRPSGDHWLAHLLSEVANRGERVDVFAGAPPYVRRQWLFPYVDGFRLVASVYRAGGFPLVNRMFARPPISTEQVLWPAAYIAGELPIRIEPPAVDRGL